MDEDDHVLGEDLRRQVKARCSLLHTNIALTVMRAAAVLARRPPAATLEAMLRCAAVSHTSPGHNAVSAVPWTCNTIAPILVQHLM